MSTKSFRATKNRHEIREGANFLTNHLATTIMMTDSEGNILWRDHLAPFGESEGNTGIADEHAKYTSKDFDDETGLYYSNARWYDPELGRFISEDPIKDGSNWYLYCLNNPLKFVDPTGLRTIGLGNTADPDIFWDPYLEMDIISVFDPEIDDWVGANWDGEVIYEGSDALALAAELADDPYIKVPGDASEFWQSQMSAEDIQKYMVGGDLATGTYSGPWCTVYGGDMVGENFDQETFEKIFPNGIDSANPLAEQFANNENLKNLGNDMEKVQQMADDGVLIIMSYYNATPNQSGHFGFVGHSDLTVNTVPATPNLQGTVGSQLGNAGPTMVQAGTFTGVTAMQYGTNGWTTDQGRSILTDNNLSNSEVTFYAVKRR